MRVIQLQTISIEDHGEELPEIELEIYGKIVDFTEIEAASTRSEWQEQYEVRKDRGSIRVRMIKDELGTRYVLTTKSWGDKRNERKEAELEVTEAMFDHFKAIADSGMIKRRYFIPLGAVVEDTEAGEISTPLEWEVDVFHDTEGNRRDWCKIDLEVPEQIDLPELPIKLTDTITNQYGQRTDEEIRKLTELFKEEFMVYPNSTKKDSEAA